MYGASGGARFHLNSNVYMWFCFRRFERERARRRGHFFLRGSAKSTGLHRIQISSIISFDETMLAAAWQRKTDTSITMQPMDENQFPDGLDMLRQNKEAEREQRELSAAIKASKKAYDAMKAMQDIESNAVSPATTVGYGSDDARSGLSNDGHDSSSSEPSHRYRFVVAICCCPLGSILCIHAATDTSVLTRSSCFSPRKERRMRNEAKRVSLSNAEHAVLDEFVELATSEWNTLGVTDMRVFPFVHALRIPFGALMPCVFRCRSQRISLQRKLSSKPKPTRCVTPQEKGGKSNSGKGGKSKSRSPKATRHRVK